jgi:hypothetical protein
MAVAMPMTAWSGPAFTADIGHMFAVFGNALAAFATDFGHVLPVPWNGEPTLSGDLLPGLGIHGGRAASAAPTRRSALDRASFLAVTLLIVFSWKSARGSTHDRGSMSLLGFAGGSFRGAFFAGLFFVLVF